MKKINNNINKFRQLETSDKVAVSMFTGIMTLLLAVVIEWGKNGFIAYF